MAEKHIPLRMCVVSRKMLPKSELLRIVVTPEGLIVDHSQKMDGRGYWISRDREVIQQAKRRHAFGKILKRNVGDAFYEQLEACVDAK